MWAENFDLDNIYTPVDADKFEQLLIESGYEESKRRFVVNGFRYGFPLRYLGNQQPKRLAPNLKLCVGSKTILWNKIMKEVKEKRVAGPFKSIPFEHYIQSPVGLVPKDNGRKTRLIFHLSYPRDGSGTSVNDGIPKAECSVKYPDLNTAVELCVKAGRGCEIGKSDMTAAFRHALLLPECWKFLIFKAEDPKSKRTYFFVEKCLPFGSSISCAHFQAISDAIAFVVQKRSGSENVNYLDDFFFAAWLLANCNAQIQNFLDVCAEIKFPVSMEKTFWGTTMLVFLGLLLDTKNQIMCIPLEKIEKAMNLINYFIDKENKKVTVLQVQQLSGLLNFLCRCIIPGRAFTTRFYAMIAGNKKLKQHHHVKIREENRLDLLVWRNFLSNREAFCRPFMEFGIIHADQINMYSDASGRLGFGALCETSWSYGAWNPKFLEQFEPSIEYLELYAVAVGILNWIDRFKNRKISLFCDNISTVCMINNASSKCKNCMVLIRLITLWSMKNNVRVFASYVNTKENGLADSLSRLDLLRFRRLGPHMEEACTSVPDDLWPVEKIWLK